MWALAATAAADELSVENAGFKQSLRIPDFADMSGITWKGGSSFYVVRDGGAPGSNGCFLHVMRVPFDADGQMSSTPMMDDGVALIGANDAEGVAYDPGSGCVWVADEDGARIAEYDPKSGSPTGRTVPIPAFVTKGACANLSLESLTISGDGLTLWTANEEALACDGATARPKFGTVVRLMRFTRPDMAAAWSAAGMWAYVCDPVGDSRPVYSGVSDLCALPDGSLLVLERECSYTTLGRTRIYRPDFTGATDIGGLVALTNKTFAAVRKGAALYEATDGKRYGDGFLRSQVSCYEGICLGPLNADGSVNLMLVSDGGVSRSETVLFFLRVSVETKAFVRALKLRGMDVRTVAFNRTERAPAAPADSSGLGPDANQVSVARELAGASAIEKPWRLGLGGFGRGGIRTGMDGFGHDRASVYGAEMDLQYGLLRRGPYDLWVGVGGAYCPRQGDVFGGGDGLVAAHGRMKIGYGELRLLAIPQRRVTEDIALGFRVGVAFDWLNAKSSVRGESELFSDSDKRFSAQGVLGVQAIYRLTERLGIYSDVDWRLGGETEFETGSRKSSVDMSGWFWSVGAFFSF